MRRLQEYQRSELYSPESNPGVGTLQKENAVSIVKIWSVLSPPSSMTDGAQQALRRIMEIYSKTTRFALACNASDKIIEPIQSRCAVLRYSKLTDGQILARLQEVVDQERLSVSDDGLEAVIFTAQGDMRQVRGGRGRS